MSKIGWPVRKAKAIFLSGTQGDFGDARKRSYFGVWADQNSDVNVELLEQGRAKTDIKNSERRSLSKLCLGSSRI